MSQVNVINRGAEIHDTVKLLGSGTVILEHGSQLRHFTVIEMCGGHLHLGERSVLGFHTMVQCTGKIVIGKNTLLGPHCSLLASYHPMSYNPDIQRTLRMSYLNIGDNVWGGSHVVYNHGITIGNDVVIGANSFVNKNFGDNVIIAGTPAKVIRAKEESNE